MDGLGSGHGGGAGHHSAVRLHEKTLLGEDAGLVGAGSQRLPRTIDRNGDGTQSLDEPGIAGQTMRLVWTDAPGGTDQGPAPGAHRR